VALWEAADHAGAMAAGAERYRESNAQGKAFTEVTMATWGSPTLVEFCASYPRAVPFPVAVGIAAGDHDIAVTSALHAYLHAFAANLVSAAVRLVPLGHTDGQRALMRLESSVAGAAAQGATGDLSLLSNTAILADMASMQHETQYTRLFRS
jgi:urease accessory protein